MRAKVTEQQYLQIFKELIRNNYQNDKYYAVISYPACIHESRLHDYNEQYANEHDITILHSNRAGGTIVAFQGDIDFFYVQDKNKVPEILNILCNYLRSKGINAYWDPNNENIGHDIVIDGIYKVATFTNTICEKNVFTAGHISMHVNLELIKHICTKPMKKTPRGLDEYGITTEEVENLFKQYYE